MSLLHLDPNQLPHKCIALLLVCFKVIQLIIALSLSTQETCRLGAETGANPLVLC